MKRKDAVRLSMIATMVAVVALGLACGRMGAPKPTPTAPAVALRVTLADQLQGTWVGHPADDPSDKWEWTIKGSDLNSKTATGEYYKGTIGNVNEQVSPATIAIKLTDCSDTSLNGQTIQGIVKVEGNKITFAFGDPSSGSRPSKFDPSEAMIVIGIKK